MAEITGSRRRYQPIPIRGLQQGGYERVDIPNPNSGMALFQSGGGAAPPNVHSLRAAADAADRAELQRVQAQEQARRNEFLANPTKLSGLSGAGLRGMNELGGQIQRQSNPEFDQWRLHGQAMKNQGVTHLQTAGAAGAKQGGGVDRRQYVDYRAKLDGKNPTEVSGYGYGPNLGSSSRGFFDHAPTESLAVAMQKSPGMTLDPTGYEQHLTKGHNLYERNALEALRKWRT